MTIIETRPEVLPEPVERKPGPIEFALIEARALLGENGEHWIKGMWCSGDSYCSIGALNRATRWSESIKAATTILAFGLPSTFKCDCGCGAIVEMDSRNRVVHFNDDTATTFEQVAEMFDKAILAARAAGV